MILLKEKRLEKKLTQAELAKLSGVPQQTISGIESNTRPNPGVDTLWPLCRVLDCSLDEMYQPDEREESADLGTGEKTGIQAEAENEEETKTQNKTENEKREESA